MTPLLRGHVGHRTEPLDDRRLRCHTCGHTLILTQPAQSTSTSRSPIPGPGEPRCTSHPTEHAGTCRTCAADAKASPDADAQHGHHDLVHQPTADVAARAAEARAALPPRAPEPATRRPLDAERMATARSELANRPPLPLPEETADA